MIRFDDYKKLIIKQAWYVHKRYGLPFNDLFAEGMYIFTKYRDNYDKDKAKFSTYLYACLKKLDQYAINTINNLQKCVPLDDETLPPFEHDHFSKFQITLEFYDSLATEVSKNAREMFEYMQTYISRTPKFHSVFTYFRKIKHWTRKQIIKTWNELKMWWLDYQIV